MLCIQMPVALPLQSRRSRLATYGKPWGGPEDETKNVRFSHAILPVLYHHFGCVCPSYEALSIISQLAKGRTIMDLGSGNGYWTYMLRVFDKKKPLTVVPVDNGISEWRTMWVGDTVNSDSVKYMQKHSDGKDQVMLLVYPQVGFEFTSKTLTAYSKSFSGSFFQSSQQYAHIPQRVTRSSVRELRTPMGTLPLPRRPSLIGLLERCPSLRKSARFPYPALPPRMKLYSPSKGKLLS